MQTDFQKYQIISPTSNKNIITLQQHTFQPQYFKNKFHTIPQKKSQKRSSRKSRKRLFYIIDENLANKFSKTLFIQNSVLDAIYDFLESYAKQFKIPGFKKQKIYKPQLIQLHKNLGVSEMLDEVLQLINCVEENYNKIQLLCKKISRHCILSIKPRKIKIKSKKSKTDIKSNVTPKTKNTKKKQNLCQKNSKYSLNVKGKKKCEKKVNN